MDTGLRRYDKVLSFLRKQAFYIKRWLKIPAFAGITLFVCAAHAQAASPLEDVEAYLNEYGTLRAEFTQIAPDGGVAEGILYLKRPGKMRWEYLPPTPILMVSNGETLVYHDKEMDEVSYLDLDDTLASFLAEPEIDLSDPKLKITRIEEEAGTLRFTLIKRGEEDKGALTLLFLTQPLELRQLQMTDAVGDVTTISLRDVETGLPLAKDLFIFKRSFFEPR